MLPIDTEKAFNTTWHDELLLYKMVRFQFLSIVIKLIKSCLSNREHIMLPIILKNHQNTLLNVPQESILAPYLHFYY